MTPRDHGRAARARRECAALPLILPAADPVRSQWWFTLDAAVSLSECVLDLCKGDLVAFLGTPIVGFHFVCAYDVACTVLDADPDIIDALNLPTGRVYDVWDDLPEDLVGKHRVVLADPPWYVDIVDRFIARAWQLLDKPGYILCTLPPRLTRAGVVKERSHLLHKLLDTGFEIVSLESKYVEYNVPGFEAHAFDDVKDFSGRPWRPGGLLVVRAPEDSRYTPDDDAAREAKIVSFSMSPRHFRVFHAVNQSVTGLGHMVEPLAGFEKNVSSQHIGFDTLSVWTSDKKAASVRDANVVSDALREWSTGKSKQDVATVLSQKQLGKFDASKLIDELEQALHLWSDATASQKRYTAEKLEQIRRDHLSDFAAQPSTRRYEFAGDGFRLSFQRDRDRILWSHALKRLANKTQVFASETNVYVRHRLAHTVEVMQLASTIPTTFGLDTHLTEAGAFAHDVGHTPFGHAGEAALDKALRDINHDIGGFNHYEHGVDVVRWLEDVYLSPAAGGFPGLNLTPETAECIIKHSYHRGNQRVGQARLLAETKHKDLPDTSCHLEGQAVRLADKVSYLISDLEDGIRLRVFSAEDLRQCRLFSRPPIDMTPATGDSMLDHFISQRRAILKVIMEDILRETDVRLSQLSNLDNVRASVDYVVDCSPPLKADFEEIWHKLIKRKLHTDSRVISNNIRSARIVSQLLLLYTCAPELVDLGFRKLHEKLAESEYLKWYTDRLGPETGIPKRLLAVHSYQHAIGNELPVKDDKYLISTHQLVQAKDYVASLTDHQAVAEHRFHFLADVGPSDT